MSKVLSMMSVSGLVALGLVACSPSGVADDGAQAPSDDGTDPASTTEQTNDPEPEPEPLAFAPLAGEWLTVVEEMVQDDCKMADWVSDGPGDSFGVANPSEGKVDIEHGLGMERCTLTDREFECETWSLEDETARDEYGLNATIVIDVLTTGVFPAEDSIEMNAKLRASCSGPDCWLVELTTASMPCIMELAIEAEAQ